VLLNDTKKLKTILAYHVVSGTLAAKDVKPGDIKTVEGTALFAVRQRTELSLTARRLCRRTSAGRLLFTDTSNPRNVEDGPERPPPVEVPHQELTTDVLRAVVETFDLRGETEYGERDIALESKVAKVMRQLDRGEV
jgi:uncharacterized protein YheU (UPF0270 family)